MKKVLLTLSLLVITMGVMAIPAKKNTWKTLKLSDGKEVRARLSGDEWGHCWLGLDGKRYVKTSDGYVAQTDVMRQAASKKRHKAQNRRVKRIKRLKAALPTAARQEGGNVVTEGSSPYVGDKKGLIILVNFKDVKFQSGHNQALYNNIANTSGYSANGFSGSVSDYFKAQSRGVFNLTFDVVGPVTVSKNMSYYGGNDVQGNDLYPEKMIVEAVNLAKNSISDWSKYDWDGDGEVDQVMIIYAGEGEASTGEEDTVWPHEWVLEAAGDRVEVGTDLYVNTYACANEVDATYDDDGNVSGYALTGIGTICHEFSHCLGLPDMYDTQYEGNYGMQDWSLMDYGSNNGGGFVPAGYTSFERMYIGWLTPQELTTAKAVTGMKALDEADDVYVITNKKKESEYYLIENRQLTGWDAALPAAGMLILHVDFDEAIWAENHVNTNNDDPSYTLNDHQRCTIFHADGKDYMAPISSEMDAIMEKLNKMEENMAAGKTIDEDAYITLAEQYYDLLDQLTIDMEGDVYPQPDNDELTNTSTPRAFTYNANSDGRKLMNVSITNIKQNNDGTMAFNFAPDNTGSGTEGDNTDYGSGSVVPDNALFYESFNDCSGTGGNDGAWSGSIASSTKVPTDMTGWLAANGMYAGDQCAKFGTSSKAGIASTPAFAVNGTTTLTFKAGAWNAKNDGTTLNLSVPAGFTISPASVTMTKGSWTNFEVTIKGTGNVSVTFSAANGRFFLDEVLAVDPNITTGIVSVSSEVKPTDPNAPMYNLAGQRVGKGYKGIVIQNGRKFVVK